MCFRCEARKLNLPDIIRFGPCEVRPSQRLLLVGGQAAAIGARSFDLLVALIERRDRVVPKNELLEVVWRDLVVEEANLPVQVAALRKVVGTNAIATIAGHGYRFVAPVDRDPAGDCWVHAAPLPPAPIALFGREQELRELHEMLRSRRLITVLGAGGIGKTAFALSAAHSRSLDHHERVVWLDLAPIEDPALLEPTLARLLGISLPPERAPRESLLVALSSVQMTVVFDNAEFLVAAVGAFADRAMAAAPGLKVLITSQAPLGLGCEQLFRLSLLAVPQAGEALASAAVAPAVAAFTHRVRLLDHRWVLDNTNIQAVVRICRRLDGLPLALLLAAGRVHSVGLEALDAHLAKSLTWLSSSNCGTPTRQQTLSAALEWSYGLLTPREQTLFRRLGAFVGGFSLDLALALGQGTHDDEPTLLSDLQGLVDHSLVVRESQGTPRYRLLESQREQALRELDRRDELVRVRDDHAAVMDAALWAAEEASWTMIDEVWLAQWAPELDNARAALRWTDLRDPIRCASLVGSLTGMYRLLDLTSELRKQAAAISPKLLTRDASLASRFWLAKSLLEIGASDESSFRFAVRAEKHAREAADVQRLYRALCRRGMAKVVGAMRASSILEEVAELESASWPHKLRCHRRLAEFAIRSAHGQWEEALAAAQMGLSLALEGGAKHPAALFANGAVVAQLNLGDPHAAMAMARDLRNCVVPGPAGLTMPFEATCVRIALKTNPGEVSARVRNFIAVCRSADWMDFSNFGDLFLELAIAHRIDATAARLLGYAEAAAERVGPTRAHSECRDHARGLLGEQFDPVTLGRLCAEGHGLDPESVSHLVVGVAESLTNSDHRLGLVAR